MSHRESPAFRYWLLLGIALHVALGLVVDRTRSERSEHAPATPVALELYLDAVEDGAAPSPMSGDLDVAEDMAPATQPPAASAPPASDSSTRLASHARNGNSQRSTSAATQVDATHAGGSATPEGAAAPSTAGESPPPETVATPAPPLSLDALGVGTFNPFLGDELAAPEAARAASTPGGAAAAAAGRLEQSIGNALAKRDQQLGLGPEGRAVSQVEQLVMQSATAPNGSATLFVRTNGEGQVVHVEVREASSDGPEWERIARELMRALNDERARVPGRSRGVSYQLRITSREQLPSGASPGLGVNLLGIPIKRGRGDKPTTISILEPRIGTQKVTLPHDPMGREVDALVVSIVPFALMADPTDIGAPARRVVHARLSDLKVH